MLRDHPDLSVTFIIHHANEYNSRSMIQNAEQEKASTYKSAKTHASSVFVTRDLDR